MTFKKITMPYILIGFAAIAQGVMWTNVFSLLHLGALAYVGGFPAGIAIVGMVVRGANQLPRVQSKRARRAGWIILAVLVVDEFLVIGSANMGFENNYLISYGASLAITLALVFGAIVERSLIVAPKPQAKAERKKPVAKKALKVPCEWCGKPIADSQNAKNAHAAYCSVLQEAGRK